MKLEIKNNLIVAIAETETESLDLIKLAHSKPMVVKDTTPTGRPKRKYKKNPIIPCDVCGKACKGNLGVAVHKQMFHGIRSQKYLQQEQRNTIPVTQG